jgi:hypothetical protein
LREGLAERVEDVGGKRLRQPVGDLDGAAQRVARGGGGVMGQAGGDIVGGATAVDGRPDYAQDRKAQRAA